MPKDHEQWYGFTQFALELNELDLLTKSLLPSTDTRFRPDQRYFYTFSHIAEFLQWRKATMCFVCVCFLFLSVCLLTFLLALVPPQDNLISYFWMREKENLYLPPKKTSKCCSGTASLLKSLCSFCWFSNFHTYPICHLVAKLGSGLIVVECYSSGVCQTYCPRALCEPQKQFIHPSFLTGFYKHNWALITWNYDQYLHTFSFICS